MGYNPFDKLKDLKLENTGSPANASGDAEIRPKPAVTSGGPMKPAASSTPMAPKPPAPFGGAVKPPTPPPSGGSGFRPAGGGSLLPPGYLSDGYFNADGYLKKELLVEDARDIARIIGQGYDGIKNAQLRKFYSHVRAADTRMIYDAPFEAVQPAVLELSAFVAEALGKKKVPIAFKEFMDKNLENIHDAKSFRQGFVKHFQAVVGFFSSFYRDNG